MTQPNGAEILTTLGEGSLLLVGCGKMGGALLQGWLNAGAPALAIAVADPQLGGDYARALAAKGVRLLADPAQASPNPSAIVLAVKPQIMSAAMPQIAPLIGPKTLLFSVAAGLPMSFFQQAAPGSAVLRAMPNTPAAIGKGVTALFANATTDDKQKALGEALAAVVGEVVWLSDEAQMDAVTAVSGSGPAYVFHMIEALAAAGCAEGLPEELAMRLARATVSGAGALAEQSDDSAETLRRNVTSPGGTTAAGLEALMAEEDGLAPLLRRTVAAAARRSRELGGK